MAQLMSKTLLNNDVATSDLEYRSFVEQAWWLQLARDGSNTREEVLALDGSNIHEEVCSIKTEQSKVHKRKRKAEATNVFTPEKIQRPLMDDWMSHVVTETTPLLKGEKKTGMLRLLKNTITEDMLASSGPQFTSKWNPEATCRLSANGLSASEIAMRIEKLIGAEHERQEKCAMMERKRKECVIDGIEIDFDGWVVTC